MPKRGKRLREPEEKTKASEITHTSPENMHLQKKLEGFTGSLVRVISEGLALCEASQLRLKRSLSFQTPIFQQKIKRPTKKLVKMVRSKEQNKAPQPILKKWRFRIT